MDKVNIKQTLSTKVNSNPMQSKMMSCAPAVLFCIAFQKLTTYQTFPAKECPSHNKYSMVV